MAIIGKNEPYMALVAGFYISLVSKESSSSSLNNSGTSFLGRSSEDARLSLLDDSSSRLLSLSLSSPGGLISPSFSPALFSLIG